MGVHQSWDRRCRHCGRDATCKKENITGDQDIAVDYVHGPTSSEQHLRAADTHCFVGPLAAIPGCDAAEPGATMGGNRPLRDSGAIVAGSISRYGSRCASALVLGYHF